MPDLFSDNEETETQENKDDMAENTAKKPKTAGPTKNLSDSMPKTWLILRMITASHPH